MARKDITDELVCKAIAEFDKVRSGFLKAPYKVPCPYCPYEILSNWTGETEKVYFRAMERAYDRGYIDYGVSLRSGWLTEKEKQLVREVAKKSC